MKIKTRRYYIYNLAVVGGFFLAILPIKLGLYLAEIAGKIAFHLVAKQRNAALENLRSAFPEKSKAEIRKIAEEVFINLSKNAVELVNIYKLTPRNIAKWVKAEGEEKLKAALSKGKGYITITAHFGNWELMAIWAAFCGHRPGVIARRLYFDRYERFIRNLRASKGVRVIYRDGSPKEILKHLRDNRGLGILADQDVDSVEGVFVNFFGKPTYTPKGPVNIALASGAPIIPGFIIREKNRHRLVFEEPIKIEARATKEETALFYTQKWSDVVESYIRKYPEQWVWMHRRWKTKPGALPVKTAKK